MKSWIAFWSILRKDMRNYYLKPPNISWGILFPVAWTLMFFLKSPSVVDVRELLPGVTALSVLFGSTSMLAVTITFERRSRSFERLLLAPISLEVLLLAKTAGAIFFGLANACVPLLLASFLTDLSGIRWPLALGSAVLLAVTSTFLGLSIAVAVREVFEAQTFSNFFRFPMMFLCGLFLPVQQLPLPLQLLAQLLPLTYGVDLLKTAINGNGFLPPVLSLAALVSFAGGLFWFSLRNIKEKWLC